MKLKDIIVHCCFLIPFVLTTFNVQVFVTTFISSALAQLIAYGNLGLLFLGVALTIKKRGELSKTSKLWLFYYSIYFVVAILASAIHYNPANILFSIIPFIYVSTFYVYLSIPENRVLFRKVALAAFVTSSILAIYLFNINFELDQGGIYMYKIDRAQGVFGDANNTALVAIIAFVFIFKLFPQSNNLLKVIKLLLMLLMLYCLVLTFSTTGFLVFIICFVLINHKFFNGIRLVIAALLLPVFYLILINLNTLTADMNLVGKQREKIENVVNILTFNTDKVDDSGRNELVMKLINDYVFENPLLGNGVDFAISQHAHNTIIGVWADAGLFTLLFFLFMLGTYFMRAISRPPDIRFFIIPILVTLCIFMLSLQSVINQPYIMALFAYLGYVIDDKSKSIIL